MTDPRPTGFPLLFKPDENGRLAFPSLEESVQQQIKIILRTSPGELLMHPDFGAGLDLALHEPNTLETRRLIRDRVATSIAQYEPRAQLISVDVSEAPGSSEDIRVDVVYLIRRTGNPARLGFTVSLGT